jgi:UPF0042 nucleotide-binding protein
MQDLSITIISGLSGSGKSTALHALEDAGFFCVDNMPILLLPRFLELGLGTYSKVGGIACSMDLREKTFADQCLGIFQQLKHDGHHLELLFLEASEAVLVKRYSQTRRQHPIAADGDLLEGIRSERAQLDPVKRIADQIIDTSDLTARQLKEFVRRYAHRAVTGDRMRITVLSFGFKYGIPLQADLVVDVRFMPNPYFDPELKALDGKDERVRQFIRKWPQIEEFFGKYLALVRYLVPLYEQEGRTYLTIAVGCTGGRHRSVAIAEDIVAHLKELEWPVSVSHRDIELG